MTDWNKMLNWKLLFGSHDFPGPDGGTCINEAAIVAAGFEYRSVKSAKDCPNCFCPIISTYAIRINDVMDHANRQNLMQFVLRLAGSAGDSNIEKERSRYITIKTVATVLPPVLLLVGLAKNAEQCEQSGTLDAARTAADAACSACAAASLVAGDAACAANYASRAASYAARAASYADGNATSAARAAEIAADAYNTRAADAYNTRDNPIWSATIAILDGALKIGNRAPNIEIETARERMKQAKLNAFT